MTLAQQNWEGIKAGRFDRPPDTDICNSVYPLRDFGLRSQPKIRTEEEFDAKFGKR